MTLPLSGVKKLTAEAFFKIYPVDAAYVLTVCSAHGAFPESVDYTGIDKLLENTAVE